MFSANDSKIPENCRYKPTSLPKNMDVEFIPMKNASGNAAYVAVLESKEEYVIDGNQRGFTELYKDNEIYAQDDTDPDDPYSLGNDPIKIFYIGSITVVGLFILFRILSKTK